MLSKTHSGGGGTKTPTRKTWSAEDAAYPSQAAAWAWQPGCVRDLRSRIAKSELLLHLCKKGSVGEGCHDACRQVGTLKMEPDLWYWK